MSKNIVVLSDGTGQEGGKGHDTNVYKLFRMLEDRTERQIVFYDEGLGTDWHKFTGNAFGAGLSKNLLQCYQFIYENYNAGDRIYLFGFSRGAATVRSLTSFIHYFGILPKSRPELIKKAYKLYEKGQDEVGSKLLNRAYKLYKRRLDKDEWEDELNKDATDFVHEHPNQWAQIEFLGVWDTVPALGVVALAGFNSFLGKILKYNFHNYKLHPSVKNAYHALSIDDDRLWFHPSLWTEKTREEQIVEQVWFSGAHTDIGGGFNEPGLSDITLEWMLGKAVSHGLRIYLGARKYWNFVVAPDPTDRYHPPRKGWGKLFKEGKRNKVWTEQNTETTFGLPIIHKSVLERHKRSKTIGDSENDRNPWILKETNKSSIYFQEDKFKKFLRHKFYEIVKFEWKKYDWKKDQYQIKKFEDWIKGSKYKKYYKSFDWDFYKVYMEDGYKEHCQKCWKDKTVSGTRDEWMDKNPYSNDSLDPDWLESYQPYKDWLKEHTEVHDNLIYYVEPVKKLEDFKPPMPLRDYDEEKLEEIIDDNDSMSTTPVVEVEITNLFRKLFRNSFTVVKINVDENKETIEKIDSKYKDLIKRGMNENEKKHDRIGYDLNRWKGKNTTYRELFSTKESMTKK